MHRTTRTTKTIKTARICRAKARGRLKAFFAVMAAAAVPLSMSGCMPYKELKEESIVEGVGIDYGLEGYTLTFQIYKPSGGGGGGGGGGNTSKSGSSNTVTLLTTSGSSLFDAVRNATLQNGRQLYFSNTRAYVIGENVCGENFSKLLDFMERNQQIRPTDRIIVAKGKAADILNFKKNGEIVPAMNLQLMMQEYVQTSKLADVQIFDISKDVATGITDPVVAAVTIKNSDDGEGVLEMDGTAVIHNEKLAGYLDKEETRGFLWITGKTQGGVLTLQLPDGGTASMEVLTSSSKISLSGSDAAPVIKVDLSASTNLTEVQSQKTHSMDQRFVEELQNIQNRTITAEANSAIEKALKTYDADIFGFGMGIFENRPELWHKIGDSWNMYDKDIKVEVTTTSTVKHTGLTTETARYERPGARRAPRLLSAFSPLLKLGLA